MSAMLIHERAMKTAKTLKNDLLKMFDDLMEVEAHQVYLQLEITSLYTYCVEMLELSPSTTKDLITVVVKSRNVPALAEAIRSKKTTIYKARKICPVLTEKNSKEWIDLACYCSCRIVEKAVAMARPREDVFESMKPIAEDLFEFKTPVSGKWEERLKETKDIMSQKQGRAVSSEEAIYKLMDEYCEKESPLRKAERARRRKNRSDRNSLKSADSNPTQSDSEIVKNSPEASGTVNRTRYRLAEVEHEVNLRDRGQCAYIDKNGKRCEQRRWLNKHHVVEFASGGEHSVENLVTLCFGHHKITHKQFVT